MLELTSDAAGKDIFLAAGGDFLKALFCLREVRVSSYLLSLYFEGETESSSRMC